MDSDLIIGIVVVVAISGVALILMRIVQEYTRRFRVRLFAEGEAALDDPSVSEIEKQVIEDLLRLSEVPAGGWLIVRAYARGAFGVGRDTSMSPSRKVPIISDRLVRITMDFTVSVLGANPAATVASIPLVIAFAIRKHMAFRPAMQTGASQEIPRALCDA